MRILLTLVLVAMPVQAATPLPPKDVYCDKGWCAIKQDTLKKLLDGTQKLVDDSRELRALCGWGK